MQCHVSHVSATHIATKRNGTQRKAQKLLARRAVAFVFQSNMPRQVFAATHLFSPAVG